jgi:hypothetical protein
MPFFANIGISWPWLDRMSRKAGADALEAGSEFLRLVAQLEAETLQDEHIFFTRTKEVADLFFRLAEVFDSSSFRVPAEVIEVSEEDYQEAGVRDASDIVGEPQLLKLDMADAYRQLAASMRKVAQEIATLRFDEGPRWQARKVAIAAREWERAYRLGRVVGVVSWRLPRMHP